MLGIIGAMESEVAGIISELKNTVVKNIGSMDFYKGQIEKKDVVVVKCGIGKVNSAMCTQAMIDNFNISGIVNTGVAGSLNNDINICDIVISTAAQEHDMDVTSLGYEKGIIPDMDTSVFDADSRLINLAFQSAISAGLDVDIFQGKIVSGDQFISSHETKEMLKNQFNGDCAEMEGAAIAHVASLNKIPFVIIRAISDKADGGALMDYPTFEKKAAKNSIALINTMIKSY